MSKEPMQILVPGGPVGRRTFLKYAGALGGAVVLGGTLGSLLEACSSASTTAGASTGSSVSAGGQQIVLNQWYHEYGEAGTLDAVKRYAAEYMQANPNVKINISWIPGDYYGKLTTALLASDAPDIYETEYMTPGMVKANQLTSIDDLLTPSVVADYGPTEHVAFSYSGKTYALKFLDDIGVVFYRKSALAAVGVTQAPETFDELVSLAGKLTSNKMKGLFLGNDGGVVYSTYVVHAAGVGDFVQNNKIMYDDPRTVNALSLLRTLNTSGSLLLDAPTDRSDPGSFINGLTAIQFSGLWIMPAVIAALGDDFFVGPYPKVGDAGTGGTWVGGYGEAINGNSKNIAAAKDYVKWLWLDNQPDELDFNTSYGFHIPPRKSLQAAATKLQTGQAAAAVDVWKTNGFSQFIPLYTPAVAQPFLDASQKILKSGADAASTIHAAAAQSQAALDALLKS